MQTKTSTTRTQLLPTLSYQTSRVQNQKSENSNNNEDLELGHSDFEFFNSADSCDCPPSSSLFAFRENASGEPKSKKQNRVLHCAEIILQMRDKHGKSVPVKGSPDAGTSETTALADFAGKGSSESAKGDPVQ